VCKIVTSVRWGVNLCAKLSLGVMNPREEGRVQADFLRAPIRSRNKHGDARETSRGACVGESVDPQGRVVYAAEADRAVVRGTTLSFDRMAALYFTDPSGNRFAGWDLRKDLRQRAANSHAFVSTMVARDKSSVAPIPSLPRPAVAICSC
jgi:hypothetical protein